MKWNITNATLSEQFQFFLENHQHKGKIDTPKNLKRVRI
jgi:hypothetical protein